MGAAARRAWLRRRHLDRDAVRGRRPALDLRSPEPDARGARGDAGLGGGGALEPVLVADGRHVAVSSSARSTRCSSPQRVGARIGCAQAMFEAVQRPAGELRRGETTPAVHASADDVLVRKWKEPDQIAIVVAGGEAGRFSAVFGPVRRHADTGRDEGDQMEYVSPIDDRTAEPVPFAPAAELPRRQARHPARHHEEPRQRAARPHRASPAH